MWRFELLPLASEWLGEEEIGGRHFQRVACKALGQQMHDNIVGDVRAASYGHTLGGAVGLSMVRAADGERVSPAWISAGDWEVDVAGVRVPARASLRPMYDPKNERIRL